jgi:GT2 family glycosyltransferase
MNPDPPLISVVIPAYNRRDSVLQLLGDIHRQEGVTFEVIVVDDRSTDDSVAAIAAQFPGVKLLQNAVNGGPAVSRNRGIREARGEFIVGVDSDVTIPDVTLFRRIVATFGQYPKATALALRVLDGDGKTDDAPRWCHPFPIEPYSHQWVWTDYFSGTGYASRRAPMLQAGLFPEFLYMHHEEVESAYRLIDIGGWILHCPDLCLLHHPHPVANRSRITIYFHPRNQVLLAAGIFPWPAFIAFLLPRTTYQFIKSVRNSHFRSYASAIRDALKLLPARLRERHPLRSATLRLIKDLRKSPMVEKLPGGPAGV